MTNITMYSACWPNFRRVERTRYSLAQNKKNSKISIIIFVKLVNYSSVNASWDRLVSVLVWLMKQITSYLSLWQYLGFRFLVGRY